MSSTIDFFVPERCVSSTANIHDPLPNQFDVYLPWASKQLALPFHISIHKNYHVNILPGTSSHSTVKKSKSKIDKLSTNESDRFRSGKVMSVATIDHKDHILIEAVFDNADNLTHIKFVRNDFVPSDILKIISLIVRFYPLLTAFTINKGLDQQGLVELNKIITSLRSNITDLILDNNTIPEANYYILLDNNTSLCYLSLARCSLNDRAVEEIGSRLTTSNLSALNLSSNCITDKGAIYLGNTLRKNRRLRYLNLAGNVITDEGADSILSSLTWFALTADEIFEYKTKRLANLKCSRDLNIIKEVTINVSNRDSKKKVKAIEKELKKNGENLSGRSARIASLDKKASFSDASTNDDDNISRKDGTYYCPGNNTLCYLNLAYNNLAYLSVKKLYEVLCAQRELNRQPKGLINVCIEGNNLPEYCWELQEINNMITGILPSKASQVKQKITRGKKIDSHSRVNV